MRSRGRRAEYHPEWLADESYCGNAMPDESNYRLEARPDTYWNVRLARAANVRNQVARLDSLPLPQRQRRRTWTPWSAMGGDYLPASAVDEVEIARLSLNSTTWDVISLRARWAGGRIRYRVVDEYETAYHVKPASSARPLTMRSVIALLDSLEPGPERRPGATFVDSYRDFNLFEGGDDIGNLIDFVGVESFFYLDLARWYQEQAREWGNRRCLELG